MWRAIGRERVTLSQRAPGHYGLAIVDDHRANCNSSLPIYHPWDPADSSRYSPDSPVSYARQPFTRTDVFRARWRQFSRETRQSDGTPRCVDATHPHRSQTQRLVNRLCGIKRARNASASPRFRTPARLLPLRVIPPSPFSLWRISFLAVASLFPADRRPPRHRLRSPAAQANFHGQERSPATHRV